MSWIEHKEAIKSEVEKAFDSAVNALEDGDKICSIFFYISLQDSITIVFDSLISKKKYFDKLREKYNENWEGSIYDLESSFIVKEYYENLAGLGMSFSENSLYSYSGNTRDKSNNSEYLKNDIRAILKAQLELQDSRIMKSKKIAEIVDLSYCLGQCELCSNGIIFKTEV